MKTEFEKYLEANTIVLGKNINRASKAPFDFKFKKTKQMKGGMHTSVTKVWDGNKVWAVKEGRFDISLEVYRDVKVPLNREFWGSLLSPFGYDLMPEDEKISKELREFFLVAKYVGYFYEEEYKVIGDNEFIREEQRKLRDDLKNFDKKDSEISSLAKRLVDNNPEKIKILKKAITSSKVINYNFLVKEYLIIAKPSNQKVDYTFYIVQEWVDGFPLIDAIEEDFSKEFYGKLILFIILSLFLFEQEQKVIDTRGANLFGGNWFVETENIVINTETEDVKFIDTRFLWDVTGNFIEKGVFTADMVLHSIITSFEHYLNDYEDKYYKKANS